MLLCKFCSKECKNDNSLRNHQRLCKLNPDRQITFLEANRSTIINSNAFIKARNEGYEFIVSVETRQRLSNSTKSRSPEWHTSLAKNMHVEYNGANLHGSWELAYAKYLDSNGIKWVRNNESFPYVYQDKQRRYTPDFYLPESEEYIEIKGYKTEKDAAKWDQFPKNKTLTILMKSELCIMGIDV